ncbi:MAG TPA: FAD-dependent oxidoreductase [Thermoanaerobaculia bacterium]
MNENAGGLPPLDRLTEPERRQALLDALSVPGYDALFVLGSFARRVTFYSQQVRALNLVDALCNSGRVTGKGEVAVIGAGVAGLTAAAGLVRRGARVRVFEKIADPSKREGRMPLQQASKQRVVHPHIYDWPHPAALAPETNLPVLNWTAAPASEVIAQMGAEFEAIVAAHPDRVRFEKANDVAIERGSSAVTWGGGKRESFEAVILAVGFGLEGKDTGWHSYWTDDSIESFEAAGGTWLISGCGDGALTDLMRLAITQFNHKKVLEEFSKAVPEAAQQELAEADRAGWTAAQLAELYPRVAKAVKLPFDLEVREIDVWLNCTAEQLYGAQASILNRLIAAFLLNRPGTRVRLVPKAAKLTGAPIPIDGGYLVEPDVMGQPNPFPFTRVVVRHGPARAVEHDFPAVWAACDTKLKEWKALAPAADWTRATRWRDGAFDERPSVPLPPDVTTKARCLLVVANAAESADVRLRVEQALTRAINDGVTIGGLPIDPDPLVIHVEEVLASPAHYAYAVRALCACQLAVFDLTGARPGAALLLGIRAAVRRGVTAAVIRSKLDAASWADLPFNIREVGVLANSDDEEAFIEALTRTFEHGLELLSNIGDSYRDLPVFDAVRRLGPNADFFRPVAPDVRILLLSWYGAQYVKSVGQRIEACLKTCFRRADGTAPPVLRIINTPSPQLVSDKLYAEIRRDRFCVVDWTGWRFNVFFELGVRLAVSADEPVSIICGDAAWLKDAKIEVPAEGVQENALRALLAPFSFSNNVKDLNEHFAACRMAVRNTTAWPGRAKTAEAALRQIPAGYTHEIIRGAVVLEGEPWGTPVWSRLLTQAQEILGPISGVKVVDSPLLFPDRGPAKRDERAGVDHLVAAWLYLDDRVEHGGDPALDAERKTLADQLYTVLENRGLLNQPEYQHIAARLETFL